MEANSRSHDEFRELAAACAAGVLDARERADLVAHLATCVECAADERSFSSTAGVLAYAVPQIDPPPALRDRVIGAKDVTVRPSVTGGPPGAKSLVRSHLPRLATAAALVLAIGLGAYAVQLRGRIDVVESQLREATARADASERRVADAVRTAAGARSEVAVVTAPDLRRIDLAGQPVSPAASGRAFWSRSRGLVFTASNLPALPGGRIYQLWIVSAQAPISVGLLAPAPDGSASLFAATPPDLPQPVAFAVTIEPAGGVPAPTGDKYLVGLVGR